MIGNKLFKTAYYIHNNGDKVSVIILGYDKKGRAWVKWNDGLINMVSIDRLEIVNDD